MDIGSPNFCFTYMKENIDIYCLAMRVTQEIKDYCYILLSKSYNFQFYDPRRDDVYLIAYLELAMEFTGYRITDDFMNFCLKKNRFELEYIERTKKIIMSFFPEGHLQLLDRYLVELDGTIRRSKKQMEFRLKIEKQEEIEFLGVKKLCTCYNCVLQELGITELGGNPLTPDHKSEEDEYFSWLR